MSLEKAGRLLPKALSLCERKDRRGIELHKPVIPEVHSQSC